jgi:hypothetical protein
VEVEDVPYRGCNATQKEKVLVHVLVLVQMLSVLGVFSYISANWETAGRDTGKSWFAEAEVEPQSCS